MFDMTKFKVTFNFSRLNVKDKPEKSSRFYEGHHTDKIEFLKNCSDMFKKDEPTATNITVSIEEI